MKNATLIAISASTLIFGCQKPEAPQTVPQIAEVEPSSPQPTVRDPHPLELEAVAAALKADGLLKRVDRLKVERDSLMDQVNAGNREIDSLLALAVETKKSGRPRDAHRMAIRAQAMLDTQQEQLARVEALNATIAELLAQAATENSRAEDLTRQAREQLGEVAP